MSCRIPKLFVVLLLTFVQVGVGAWILPGVTAQADDQMLQSGTDDQSLGFSPGGDTNSSDTPADAGDQGNKSDQPLVQASLFQTDIRDALSEISYQTGVNILMTPDVRGTVTAELTDVPLETALDILLSPFGYVYRKTDSFYLVGIPDPRSLSFPKLSETAVINLDYIDPTLATQLLSDSYRSFVKADPEGRRLIVTAPHSIVERVRSDVALFDRPPAEIRVQVVVSELTKRAASELGISEAQYSKSGENPLGINFTPTGIGLSFQQLLAKLRLLQESGEVEIRADPEARVTEGKQFKLFAGMRHMFRIDMGDATDRIEKVETGVELSVTARVLGQDELTLNVSPKVDQVVSENRAIPLIQANELTTTVRLRTGQTAVLASMTLDRNLKGEQQVPGIGNLPLIGWLFRQENRESSQRRLVIFISPEILSEPGDQK